ncbi:MAG: toll/interleukin-1 receptor domain-containing protein, partial [Lachnospiraceae bacterium]|nr:toll/interleukin-1 receptor domain-containing protein [Lachnospiraceae bacterium]
MEKNVLQENEAFRYDAFISYRHAPLDQYVAQTLQRRLESFKVPRLADKETKELGKKSIRRIFRDRDELPLAGNLSEPIMEALSSSENLIVICSPRILESQWCKREIETFIALRGMDHVFAVLIEGAPDEAFPEPLRKIQKEVVGEAGSVPG